MCTALVTQVQRQPGRTHTLALVVLLPNHASCPPLFDQWSAQGLMSAEEMAEVMGLYLDNAPNIGQTEKDASSNGTVDFAHPNTPSKTACPDWFDNGLHWQRPVLSDRRLADHFYSVRDYPLRLGLPPCHRMMFLPSIIWGSLPYAGIFAAHTAGMSGRLVFLG